MAKFVLIDHSISGVGGHYYEYAARVLQAAAESGYEPVLATNRKFRDPGPLPWQVVRAYRYDFFEPGPPKLLTTTKSWLAARRRLLARWKYRLMFSRVGLLWLKKREGAIDGAISSRRLLVAAVAAEMCLYCLRMARALGRLSLAIMPLEPYVRNVFRAGRQLLATAAGPWRALLANGSFVWRQAHCWRKRGAFAADSVRLFQTVSLDHGDLVFIPTLAEADMLGLLTLFRANPDTAKASWHLIFRRNIYQGREPEFAGQDESLRPLRNAFRQFQAQLSGQRVYFYTDTDPLTVQYNRLGAASFRTVPIPVAADYRAEADAASVDYNAASRRASEHSLHVVYIGDARTEKGYHWLPHLVGDSFAAGLPVRFTFQSNFNIPQGEPAPAVARTQLEALPPSHRVELLKHPLASEPYRRLLLDSDVVVIPYDRDNYYARSSGIFAEALVAGKPVIVPAGTWMATELSAAVCDYHESLRSQHRSVGDFRSCDLEWESHQGKCAAPNEVLVRDRLPVLGRAPTYCSLDLPAGATHLLVSFRLDGESRGTFPGITVEQFDGGRSLTRRTATLVGGASDERGSALLRITAETQHLRVGISNSLSVAPIQLKDVRLDFLSADRALPASVIGTVYTEPHQLFAQLREILNHYAHYRASAVDFSRNWSRYHCAQALVEHLVGSERLRTTVSQASSGVEAADRAVPGVISARRAA
ncbi:MAG TPA: glycosyltransferase [Pirellulales bacterium]|nr:glycosyltransferase [Pirellulales bacterium]